MIMTSGSDATSWTVWVKSDATSWTVWVKDRRIATMVIYYGVIEAEAVRLFRHHYPEWAMEPWHIKSTPVFMLPFEKAIAAFERIA